MDISHRKVKTVFRVTDAEGHPFYWGRYEPVEGEPDRDSLMKTAEYMKSKGDYLVSVDGTEQKMTLVQDGEKVIVI